LERGVRHTGKRHAAPLSKKPSFGQDLVVGMKLVMAHQRGEIELEQVWPRPRERKASAVSPNPSVLVAEDHRSKSAMAEIWPLQSRGRKLSKCIAIAKAYEEELGYAPVPDADFAADVRAAVDAHREPLNPQRGINVASLST